MEVLISLLEDKLSVNWIDYISIFATGLSVILIYLTYNLARKINKKIDKPIIERQFNVFSDFLHELNTLLFDIKFVEIKDNLQSEKGCFEKLSFFELDEAFFEIPDNSILFFKTDHEFIKLLKKYQVNPLMPKSIILPLIEMLDENDESNSNGTFILFGELIMTLYSELENVLSSCLIIKKKKFHLNYKLFYKAFKVWIDNPKIELNLKK